MDKGPVKRFVVIPDHNQKQPKCFGLLDNYANLHKYLTLAKKTTMDKGFRITIAFFVFLVFGISIFSPETVNAGTVAKAENREGFINAADFGFSPDASGVENVKALQKATDQAGTIIVSIPGTYKIAGTVYIGDNTSLVFGNNVFLKKVDEKGVFDYVFLNKGALTKTYNEHITIDGLSIIVNEIEQRYTEIYGLRGQLSFFYIKDLRIERFRCYDLTPRQFCIHVCTFEDIIIDDVIIKGKKDGIHLGPGNRFTIRDCVFQTFDDAIALNAHDYATSNPELGWIENGVVENCYDLNA